MEAVVRPVIVVLAALGLLLGAAAVHSQEPHWDYFSHGGPEHWGDEFPDCNLPAESPVDIAGVAPRTGITVDYRPSPLVVFNNGHTIQAAYERGSFLTVDGKRYELIQLHFHSPSEHTFNGSSAAMETHLVHRAADGELAVLGVLVVEGAPSEAFEAVLDQTPVRPGNSASLRTIDAAAFLPTGRAFYAYDGSLTTPPCSDGVKWHVFSSVATVSAAQLAEFRALEFLHHDGRFIGNARPVQPLNGRLGDATPSRIRVPSTGSGGLR